MIIEQRLLICIETASGAQARETIITSVPALYAKMLTTVFSLQRYIEMIRLLEGRVKFTICLALWGSSA